MRALYLGAVLVAGCGRIGFDPDTSGTAEARHAIAAGDTFSCALRQGRVWCWGANELAQLGLVGQSGEPRPIEVPLPSDRAFVAIDGGERSACALDDAGGVWCWGDNEYSELARAPSSPQAPVPIALALPATGISVGGRHACAVLEDDSAWCWGDNRESECGRDRLIIDRIETPVRVLDSGVLDIVAGQFHTCALRADHTVWCWGHNQSGQLGDGLAEPVRETPRPATGLGDVSAIASGSYHMCALVKDGRYICWGSNSNGAIGDPQAISNVTTPGPPSTIAGLIAVTAGSDHTCALGDNGAVLCWGDNDRSQLGDGTNYDTPMPLPTLVDGLIRGIAAGANHTCALRDDDSVACWGVGSSGQLGDGTVAAWARMPVGLPGNATAVAAGDRHACAIVSGDVWCWGNNYSGQLGSDGPDPLYVTSVPRQVLGVTGATALGLGGNHSCAMLASGELWCWGGNEVGQLGLNAQEYSRPPARVGTFVPSAVDGGLGFTCTVDTGNVFCWGLNYYGQIGDSGVTMPVVLAPYQATSGTTVTLGDHHACTLDSQQHAVCWGFNAYQQLGIGFTSSQPEPPTQVTGASQYTSIAAGQLHTCAVTTAQGVDCWGTNSGGQLGDGTLVSKDHPVPVSIAGVSRVAAGGDFSCAVATGGNVSCWGSNQYGQLANNSTLRGVTPVASFAGVAIDVTAGLDFACMLSGSGSVYCWGDNVDGAVGSGSISRHAMAVDVQFP